MKQKLLLSLFTLITFSVLLLIAEFAVRFFAPNINFQGTDQRLVRENAFGQSHGWQPDATGTSFGKMAHINGEGFRDLGGPSTADSSILLIGDSVTFGVGVDSDSTFAGMIQQMMPSVRVINSAAVGYSVQNYRDVLSTILERDSTIRRVVIFYSLNDFYGEGPFQVQAWSTASFFRNNSKLYLWLKNLLFDRSKIYYQFDFQNYYNYRFSKGAEVRQTMETLVELVQKVEKKGLTCTVVLIPYEYQIRTKQEHNTLPQAVVASYLSEHNTHCIDTYSAFANEDIPSSEFFLYGDHMHLSTRGHRAVLKYLKPELHLISMSFDQ